ncbi:MAG: hypothetical protein ACR2LK_09245 [Solirubrobacteraceae bacterium]
MTDSPPGRAAMTQADFAYLERLAAAAADSGLYGGGNKIKAQLLMKLIYGRDLGIPVSAALSAINIYDGKMELSANLIAALLEAHPHYAYAIVETGNEGCELEFFKDGRSLGKAKFDVADATTAGLADTEYYRQYPSDMFFARAITRGARRYCPGLGRGVAIYATGELAKRTPEPTTVPRPLNGAAPQSNRSRGAQEPRAREEDRRRIRALAADAQLSDADLFNVLVVAAGSEPVMDEQRAARQLDRALECLPVSLIAKVTELLTQREAPAGVRSANGSGQSETAHDVADG